MAADNKADTGRDGGRRATGAAARRRAQAPRRPRAAWRAPAPKKLLSAEQLEEALAEKDETGDRLGQIVIRHGWVSGRALAHALAEQHELEYIDLAQTEIEAAGSELAAGAVRAPVRGASDPVSRRRRRAGRCRRSGQRPHDGRAQARTRPQYPSHRRRPGRPQANDRPGLPRRSQGRRPRHRAPQGGRDG